MIKDSGQRKQYASGGVRDIRAGKGKCDLLPLKEVYELLEFKLFSGNQEDFSPIRYISNYIETAKEHPFGVGDERLIYMAIYQFAHEANWDIPTVILEVSKHFEEGAVKYKRNNWRLALPASCYLDSGIRHYLKWKRGDNDENHDRAFVWNMLCMIWTVRNRPDYNDIPDIEKVRDVD